MNINYALGIEVSESEEWQTSLSNNSHLIQLELESPPGPTPLFATIFLRCRQPSQSLHSLFSAVI